MERVLGMEFYDAVDRSLFYRGSYSNCKLIATLILGLLQSTITLSTTDPGYSFDSVLFYGNEWSLLLLDILVFAVVDLIAESYVLAAIITYIVSWVRTEREVETSNGLTDSGITLTLNSITVCELRQRCTGKEKSREQDTS